jgi:superfamily II DNA or RNA helicase
MPNDIIDNQSENLVDVIRRILPGTQSAKFAVGYFFLSGLEAVSEALQNVGELRLLIGNTTNRETIEQIAEGYRRLEQVHEAVEALAYPKRVEQSLRTTETAHAVGQALAATDQTDEAERLAGILVQLIEQKRLKVRVYTKGRLHAKAYIFDYGPVYGATGQPIPRDEKGIAVVGSSNFTLSGISHNTELNVRVHGNENHKSLTEWFTRLWDESQDFEEQLMQELRQSWPLAQVTPYEIYLKTLYELVGERLDGEGEAEFLWQSEISAVLTDFQLRAVKEAVRIIREFGGCFVSDVVGLGKSYIGAAIVKHFERAERARPLIICPVSLQDMWEHYNEIYGLNARVLPMSMLRENDDGLHVLLDDEKYRDRDFVLIDESHNFRHHTSQRYKVLQAYLQSGDRRCVLLTATPRNKTAWDIYHQIQLFHRGDITLLPIEPPNLKTYFKLVEDGERALPSLLSHLLIRRTRTDILRWYGYDSETHRRVDPDNFVPYRHGERRAYVHVAGRHQFFPRRDLQTIEYNVEKTYRGLYRQLREFISPRSGEAGVLPGFANTTDHLVYARYGLWHYVQAQKKTRAPYNELQRAGINLRGLLRVSLFKRLESSVEAFRKTLNRMIQSHEAFLAALGQGIVPAGEKAQRILYESDQYDEAELYDALNAVTGRYEAEDFMLSALRDDIQHDLNILREMYRLVEPIIPGQDAKLQKLILRLAELSGRKCLIFTQYADTAVYLHENLNPGPVRDPGIEVIFGNDKNKTTIVGRFAPKANPEHKPREGQPEIQTLIATDVLSEGLNMQDCDQVINYDLHWNPVRLIQRFGRIDRIGSEHDVVCASNFLPETELESNLGLREKLQHRIQEIHDTIGEDAAILDPSEQLNEEAFYSIYESRQAQDIDDSDADQLVDLNEVQEFMRQLREDDPVLFQRVVSLKDGIRCGYSRGQEGAVVLCRAGSYRQLYLTDKSGEIISRDIPKILNLMRCAPNEPSSELPIGYNLRVMGIYRRFGEEVRARLAEQSHTVSLTIAQRYALEELQALMSETRNADLQGQISLMSEVFSRPQFQAVRQELNGLRTHKVSGRALLDSLSKIYVRYNLKSRFERAEREDAPLPLIVCSEALLG